MITSEQSVEWRLTVPPERARARLEAAFAQLKFPATSHGDTLHASAPRAYRKNRWAAEIDIELRPAGDREAIAVCRVDMAGNKHLDIVEEIAAAAGEDLFDDRGLAAAELDGKERRLLGHVLLGDERIVALGRGTSKNRRVVVVLTNRRLFRFDKGMGARAVDELALDAVESVERADARLRVRGAGEAREFELGSPDQAEAFARGFRDLRPGVEDPLGRLERLAALRQSGAITDAEFERLKGEIIGR